MSIFTPRAIETLLRDNSDSLKISKEEDKLILNKIDEGFLSWSPTIHYPNEIFIMTNEDSNFKFYYDSRRFSPFAILENYSKASQLLKELTRLNGEIKIYKRAELELQNEKSLLNKRKEIYKKTKLLLEEESKTLNNTKELKIRNIDSLPRKIYAVDIEHNETSLKLKLEIEELKLILEEEELSRKETLHNDPNSSYSNKNSKQRAMGAYIHKTTEISMIIEVLRHGLFVLFNIEPKSLIDNNVINFDTDSELNTKIEWFNLFKIKNEILLTSIEKYLWGVAKISQRKLNNSYSTVEYLKLQPKINDDKEIKFTYSPFIGSTKNSLLKGISIEFIYKDNQTFQENTSLTRPYLEPNFTKKTHEKIDYQNKNTDNKVRVTVTPPFQKRYTSDSNQEYDFSKKFSFYAQVNRKDISSLRKDSSENTFYGTNIIKNINPEGKWKVEVTEFPNNDFENSLEQIAVYFHQNLY
jgi:hypothetical protein